MRSLLVLLLCTTNVCAQDFFGESADRNRTVDAYFQKVAELGEENGALKEKLKQSRLLLEAEKKKGGSWYESPSLWVGLLFGAAAGFTAGYSLLR
jgi:hypothetical protein